MYPQFPLGPVEGHELLEFFPAALGQGQVPNWIDRRSATARIYTRAHLLWEHSEKHQPFL